MIHRMLTGAALCTFNGASRTFTLSRIVCICALLAGCGGPPEPVPYITSELPEIPATCVSPSTPEPKLDPNQDASDLDALKHVLKMKSAYRTEKHLRKSCGEELKAQRGK